jgi:septal ring factor EnvC (AmiA/AmiB activator)
MGDDVTINGSKLPWSAAISVLVFTFWLGGLSLSVVSNAESQKEHEQLAAHAEAALATNTVQADVKHNKEEIEEIKKQVVKANDKLDAVERQMAKDKADILKAIRDEP